MHFMDRDIISEAQELVKRFHGKITERWGTYLEGDYNGDMVHMGVGINSAPYATEIDMEAMASVPEMVNIIKVFLDAVDAIRDLEKTCNSQVFGSKN